MLLGIRDVSAQTSAAATHPNAGMSAPKPNTLRNSPGSGGTQISSGTERAARANTEKPRFGGVRRPHSSFNTLRGLAMAEQRCCADRRGRDAEPTRDRARSGSEISGWARGEDAERVAIRVAQDHPPNAVLLVLGDTRGPQLFGPCGRREMI